MKGILFILDSTGDIAGGIEGKILLIAEDLYRRRILRPVLLTSGRETYFALKFTNLGFPAYGFWIKGTKTVTLTSPRNK